ncbi:hypothetical protein E2C01_051814 [Portunus trituberculatus]|uniref:Uncharacterized protein n=1 Tax=Portunus trituberculatus TaxID=210409 RepID=A0A5B7GJV5_PORTR|nr:hypothetical protein [Portunus trituberculatus]
MPIFWKSQSAEKRLVWVDRACKVKFSRLTSALYWHLQGSGFFVNTRSGNNGSSSPLYLVDSSTH